MTKLKKVSELICPKCGKNDPVFFIDFELRAWPIGDMVKCEDIEFYDLDIENDFGYMASSMDDAIMDGTARCECCSCGTPIEYLEEIEDETKHTRSSK